MPKTLRRAHPLIAASRAAITNKGDGWYGSPRRPGVIDVHVTRSSVSRSLRLVQAIVDELGRRGGGVESTSAGCSVFLRSPHCFVLTVSEETDKTPHVPTATELAEQERRSFRSASGYLFAPSLPKYDHHPSGRLSITTTRPRGRGTVALANDRKRWTCEDRLPRAVALIEEMTVEAEKAAVEAAQLQLRRHEYWERAVEIARKTFTQAWLVDVLDERLARHRRLLEVGRYLQRLRQAPTPDPDETVWIAWVSNYLANLQAESRSMPDVPDPSMTDLAPFMPRGMSPYGPEVLGSYWRLPAIESEAEALGQSSAKVSVVDVPGLVETQPDS